MSKKDDIRKQLESLREEIKNKTTKVKPGKADGATFDGSVCAAGFGSSLLGKAQSRHNYLVEKRKENKHTKVKSPPSKRQIAFAEKLGITLPDGCTKKRAIKIIGDAVKKKQNKKGRRK